MKKEDIEAAKIRFDLAWKWFDLHAKQRQSNIQFSLTMITGLFAVSGYLINSDHFYVASIVSMLGILGSIMFLGLDRRNSYLVKLGESGISAFEDIILKDSQYKEIRILSGVDNDNKFYFKYSTAAIILYISSAISFVLIFLYCALQLIPDIKKAHEEPISTKQQLDFCIVFMMSCNHLNERSLPEDCKVAL